MNYCPFCHHQSVRANGEHIREGPLTGYRARRCEACGKIVTLSMISGREARRSRLRNGMTIRHARMELTTNHGQHIIGRVLATGKLPKNP